MSRAIRQRRAQLSSPRRKLHAGQRALLVLAYLSTKRLLAVISPFLAALFSATDLPG